MNSKVHESIPVEMAACAEAVRGKKLWKLKGGKGAGGVELGD